MLKSNINQNKRLTNEILSEINSDLNRFQNLYHTENNKKDNLLNKNYSYLLNDEKEYNNFISDLNDFDLISIDNSTNNDNKLNKIFQNDNDNNNPLTVYKEIKIFIEKFINEYITEKTAIYFTLKEVFNAIIIIIKNFTENYNSSRNENKQNLFITSDGHNIKSSRFNLSNLELDINSKIVFLLSIQKLNDKIKKLQEEIEFFKNIIDIPKKKIYGQNIVDMFKKKYMDQKIKNKKEEYKYLLCIEEQEKRINSLQKELKKKEKENLPIDTIKLVRCFPNFHQYDFKEDINPKSIPLFHQFNIEKIIDKYLQKDNFKTPRNLSQKMKNRKILFDNNNSSDKSKLLFTNTDLYVKKNVSKTKRDKPFNLKKIKSYNLEINNFNNINSKDNEYRKNKTCFFNTDSNLIKNNKDEKDQKHLKKNIRNYHPKTILDNKKEFFIAHPTLNIAGVIKKKELKYVGLPKKIIKLKVHKSLEKNMMITFPSSLNETLVNLEKLRKCKIINNITTNEYK